MSKKTWIAVGTASLIGLGVFSAGAIATADTLALRDEAGTPVGLGSVLFDDGSLERVTLPIATSAPSVPSVQETSSAPAPTSAPSPASAPSAVSAPSPVSPVSAQSPASAASAQSAASVD